MFDLLWPAVIVVFVGCVFILVTRLIALALGEREAEWGGGETQAPLTAPPPMTPA